MLIDFYVHLFSLGWLNKIFVQPRTGDVVKTSTLGRGGGWCRHVLTNFSKNWGGGQRGDGIQIFFDQNKQGL